MKVDPLAEMLDKDFPKTEKFNPCEGSFETRRQMLSVILIRELREATTEDDLRARLAAVLKPPPPKPAPDELETTRERILRRLIHERHAQRIVDGGVTSAATVFAEELDRLRLELRAELDQALLELRAAIAAEGDQ